MLAPINNKKRPILASLNVTDADGYLLVETTGLAISDCYRRSIACSVTLVTGCANIAQRRCNRHSSPLYKKKTTGAALHSEV